MIAIRPARDSDAAGIARVHVDAWHAALDTHVPGSMREAVSFARYQPMWESLLGTHAGSHTTLIATDRDDQPVGFASAGAGTAGFDCELHALYVAPRFQRRNIGCRLFHDLTAHLRAEGCASMAASVLDTAQARGFFLAMGGALAGTQAIPAPGAPEPVMDLFIWRPLALPQT
jgi:ribosomal protein S18 acetylase RimI-like enzyme